MASRLDLELKRNDFELSSEVPVIYCVLSRVYTILDKKHRKRYQPGVVIFISPKSGTTMDG